MNNQDDIERKQKRDVYKYRPAPKTASPFFAPLESDIELLEETWDIQAHWGLDLPV